MKQGWVRGSFAAAILITAATFGATPKKFDPADYAVTLGEAQAAFAGGEMPSRADLREDSLWYFVTIDARAKQSSDGGVIAFVGDPSLPKELVSHRCGFASVEDFIESPLYAHRTCLARRGGQTIRWQNRFFETVAADSADRVHLVDGYGSTLRWGASGLELVPIYEIEVRKFNDRAGAVSLVEREVCISATGCVTQPVIAGVPVRKYARGEAMAYRFFVRSEKI